MISEKSKTVPSVSGYWKMIPPTGQPEELFKNENEIKHRTAHNIHENYHRRQYGGNMMMTLGEAATQVVATGEDDTGLGR